MPEPIVTRILGIPGYGVYREAFDEAHQTLTLWVRPTAKVPYYCCRGCGISTREARGWTTRRVRDLPWGEWQIWLVVAVHRLACRRCGRRTLRFEAAVARDCERAPVRRVAAQWGLAAETVRQIDTRALQRWAAGRPRKPLRSLGVDEISLGKQAKFLTVVSNLETREPLWAGKDRKRETLDRFFADALPPRLRRAVRAVCVDMGEPDPQSLRAHLPRARIVYDTFPGLQHANAAVDETRRAEFFRKGGRLRGLVRGKRWLLLTR